MDHWCLLEFSSRPTSGDLDEKITASHQNIYSLDFWCIEVGSLVDDNNTTENNSRSLEKENKNTKSRIKRARFSGFHKPTPKFLYRLLNFFNEKKMSVSPFFNPKRDSQLGEMMRDMGGMQRRLMPISGTFNPMTDDSEVGLLFFA